MDEFYVTLPSAVNLELYPENNASNWITEFNPPLILKDDWTVGLSEIHLPKKWNNITSANSEFLVTFGDIERTTVSETIPKGPTVIALAPDEIETTILKDVYYKTRLPYAKLSHTDAISFTMSGDPEEPFTRERYLSRLQILFEYLEDTEVNGIKFADGIKIEYKQATVNNEAIYIYEISFKNGWKMLYDANDLEPQHIQISRFFGCVPCNFFKPMSKTLSINKFDNLDGQIPEYEAKIQNHRIYLYNTQTFDEKEKLMQR